MGAQFLAQRAIERKLRRQAQPRRDGIMAGMQEEQQRDMMLI